MKDPIRVTSATKLWRKLGRLFARTEWAIWLLGLKRHDGAPTDPGLVMIQIDGLPRKQLQRAIADGRMPFTSKLLEKERYVNHSFYSGLPSSTPAVQAELFYGERTVVPAFGFRDHRSGQLVRMFETDVAVEVEQKLQRKRRGLLDGGSSYSNNYDGDAAEVHFCATSFGWNEFLNTLNPFQILMLMFLNFWMFFRIIGLMLVEFFLAILGCVDGILSGRRFWQELIMIPARVVVVVFLRELITIGACYDAARGLPIIHLNFLGFDEQAHRRGPESRFAHWTLVGIDRCIKQIWKAAHQGAGREYDFWIFSDHGQETTRPYQVQHRKLVQQVVADVVEEFHNNLEEQTTRPSDSCSASAKHRKRRLPSRANWIGLGWLVTILFGEQDHDIQSRSSLVQTVTSSSLGFVYLLTEQGKSQRAAIAKKLISEKVPMCVYLDNNIPMVITQQGTFRLPANARDVLGDHPFIEEIVKDMHRMVLHEDSGDILMFGWNGLQRTSSFVLQNGAHAGIGIEETGAFALLPIDVKLPVTNRDYLRPDDLRLAALRFLGRDNNGRALRRTAKRPAPIRILSYNVHACVGMDGQLSPERIAKVIDQSEADIVCLQELDVFRLRSGNRDQAHAIAKYLGMSHQFHPAWRLEEESFGNAILTRLPMRLVQKQALHHHKSDRSRRSALWVEIDLDDRTSLQVINTHLSIYPQEQLIQTRQLAEEWIQPAQLLGSVVLCGDLNARPGSATHRVFSQILRDIESFDANPIRRTLFSPLPIFRVDHGFVSPELSCCSVTVIDSRLAKVASDHLPLLFEIVGTMSASCGNSGLRKPKPSPPKGRCDQIQLGNKKS